MKTIYRIVSRRLNIVSIFATSLLATHVLADTNVKEVYLNKDLGFNVKGYNYNQKELPCNVDTYLVKQIAARGKQKNIEVKTVATGDSIPNGKAPVIAIEIDSLSLGKKGFNFGGKDTNNVLPAMKVTVGLIRDDSQGGTVLAKHSCAILTLNQISPVGSSILDMGTYGVSVCDATHKCLNSLSKDIVDWVAPQI